MAIPTNAWYARVDLPVITWLYPWETATRNAFNRGSAEDAEGVPEVRVERPPEEIADPNPEDIVALLCEEVSEIDTVSAPLEVAK